MMPPPGWTPMFPVAQTPQGTAPLAQPQQIEIMDTGGTGIVHSPAARPSVGGNVTGLRQSYTKLHQWSNDKQVLCQALRKNCMERLKGARLAAMCQARFGAPAAAAPRVGTGTAADCGIGAAAVGGWNQADRQRAVRDVLCAELKSTPIGSRGPEYDELLEEVERLLLDDLEEQIRAEALYEDCALESTVSLHLEDAVPCPLCKTRKLEQRLNWIVCPCGMKISNHNGSLTLASLGQQLRSCVEDHGQTCDKECVCTVVNMTNQEMLVMSCSVCDFLSII
ncbi:hypothetical protein Pelo_18309 [Pelomyxa schiedti]|nr:hypothetical protein Pelo_18309 [Pelomyxa schiedti]